MKNIIIAFVFCSVDYLWSNYRHSKWKYPKYNLLVEVITIKNQYLDGITKWRHSAVFVEICTLGMSYSYDLHTIIMIRCTSLLSCQ